MKSACILFMAMAIVLTAGPAVAQQESATGTAPMSAVHKSGGSSLILRGVYGPDDAITLPQLANTSYRREHDPVNRSAREFPTLDSYRPSPGTPSCPLYTRPGQDELTLPQLRGDCER